MVKGHLTDCGPGVQSCFLSNKSNVFNLLQAFFSSLSFFWYIIVEQWRTYQVRAARFPGHIYIYFLMVVHNTYQHMPYLAAIVDCTNVGPP